MQTELQSLQNAANDLGIVVNEVYQQDKRRTVGRYFATLNGTSVSGTWDYEQLNYFLHGWRAARKHEAKAIGNLGEAFNGFM
jgi:hypothetical protein